MKINQSLTQALSETSRKGEVVDSSQGNDDGNGGNSRRTEKVGYFVIYEGRTWVF